VCWDWWAVRLWLCALHLGHVLDPMVGAAGGLGRQVSMVDLARQPNCVVNMDLCHSSAAMLQPTRSLRLCFIIWFRVCVHVCT
jgi:hypothetical protein